MVLQAVDQALGMFGSYAKGEGLGFDQYLLLMQEVKNIPGRMACGEDDCITMKG